MDWNNNFVRVQSEKAIGSKLFLPSGHRLWIRLRTTKKQPKETRYQGQFELGNKRMGYKVLSLSYSRTLDGEWSGKLHSFGRFNSSNLQEYIRRVQAQGRIKNPVPNALISQWTSFIQDSYGNFLWKDFLAALVSIEKESWNDASVVEACEKKNKTGSRCYLSTSGYRLLSRNEKNIPGAVTTLNLALSFKNLKGRRKKDKSLKLEGHILTSRALQFPGNPKFSLELGPLDGEIRRVKHFAATVYLGGRYYPSTGKCKSKAFKRKDTPWLVPGFMRGVSLKKEKVEGKKRSFKVRYECVDKEYPFHPADGELSASLNLANPIPNGRRLVRKLELVDGALIDNKYLFIIYKEGYPSFFPLKGPGGAKGRSATPKSVASQRNTRKLSKFENYGYFLLERSFTKTKKAVKTAIPHLPCKSSKDCSERTLQICHLKEKKKQGFCTTRQCSNKKKCPSGWSCERGKCRLASTLEKINCSARIYKEVFGTEKYKLRSKKDIGLLVKALINGVFKKPGAKISGSHAKPTEEILCKSNGSNSKCKSFIHYYCQDTDSFDGGPGGGSCPVGSKVIFFQLPKTGNLKIKNHSCHKDNKKRCASLLTEWQDRRKNTFFMQTPYCIDGGANCDLNRYDLRIGKKFFPLSEETKKNWVFKEPIKAATLKAFRYRIKFRSRRGKQIGFAPEPCEKDVPYCYKASTVENIEDRVSCLLSIYSSSALESELRKDPGTLKKLESFVKMTFAQEQNNVGFETLNAELRITLGDEAYINALSSRFDLANSNQHTFFGDKFEPKGIRLAGSLGYEMHNLYQSTQYYQSVLDRFFSISHVIYLSFQTSTKHRFITPQSITSYFTKLILASANKARAWSQIAIRYQQLQRADLARFVVERAYIATFTEYTIFTRLMSEILKPPFIISSDWSKYESQIRMELRKAALAYKTALFDMEEVYRKLSQSLNPFGFQSGYIPFPVVDNPNSNAFKTAFAFAKQKMQEAKQKEKQALQNKRQFDYDRELFQNELVKIGQNYEKQLLEICGSFRVKGRVYPAITKYTPLLPKNKRWLNPCGFMGNGQLFSARVGLDRAKAAFYSLRAKQKETIRSISIEQDRIKRYCRSVKNLATYIFGKSAKRDQLQSQINSTQDAIARYGRYLRKAESIASMTNCSIGFSNSCVGAAIGIGIVVAAYIAHEVTVQDLEKQIRNKKDEIAKINRKIEYKRVMHQCETAAINSRARILEYYSKMKGHELEALVSFNSVRMAISNIVSLQQKSQFLLAKQKESNQLAINVQAAKNDPNVRIYKNDAIISAENTFTIAIREAYRSTLIYEYYTGQTYKHKDKLFLIRMISHGRYNLESYLTNLQLAFREFEEQNGRPDFRMAIYSLRDDILRIPYQDKSGNSLTTYERILELRKQISNASRINSEGYYTFPFQIKLSKGSSKVSPITINHKIRYVEAEIIGYNTGDQVGRIYLRQLGTTFFRLPRDRMRFFSLPPRTAVINTFFNGKKQFSPKLYSNHRLRDRPLGSSHWELLFNDHSELVNQDIKLNTIDDIRIYFYYTDFTEER